ncbi:M48 family metalloprotease [Sporosarcina sp. G11-34]|nr:M48 family metalloprotease [Sporosarcina sp. G11-34]
MQIFPNELLVLLCVFVGLGITLVTFFLSKKVGTAVEVISLIAFISYFFIIFPFWEAMMLMSYVTISYGIFGIKLDREKRAKRIELESKLKETTSVELIQTKNFKRIIADFALTLFVIFGALLFYLFAPEIYAVLKFLIVLMFIGVLAQMIERIGNYYSTKSYWLPEEKQFIISSFFQSREFPIEDLKEITQESAPDLLKLHPLFTILSANQDYTSSFQSVLKLSFPGENIYITPSEVEKWHTVFRAYVAEETESEVTKVLPLWHPKVLKRLFWKGYFAITVKGVSAYTGLLFILIWLEVPSFVIVGFVLFWWVFNLYVSDRVLVTAMDAEELTEGDIFERSRMIFREAGIPSVKIFLVDSPIHNGLATGMNIGRGTVMITKATSQLSIEAVEAIVAHEAIHIKKRDVLMIQVARLAFLGFVAGVVYLFFDQLVAFADNLFVILPFFYCLMLAFPTYLSFVEQWAEVRADHLGAELLVGGRAQMKSGLHELGEALDNTQAKTVEYGTVKENSSKVIKMKNLERSPWFIRLIEFHFLAHPPLYWRIHMLSFPLSWKGARRKWMVGRLKESLPNVRKISTKN